MPGPPGAVMEDEKVTLFTNKEAADALRPSDKQVLSLNRRAQAQNRAPEEFPGFVRLGFDIVIVADGYQVSPEGLLFKDFKEGVGAQPEEGQQVVFDYTGYNESGVPIDSSYRQGRPAETRLGIAGLIPGFELGIRSMKVGGKRRIIVPPKLGPPVGPSTFFSAKQCEVFDIELRGVRTCRQEQVMMFSRVVCE
ncbi:MAG: FKBP-type peptidyl-prolyl cis-trans isomerase [Monoraphidium minutum]|nr:MAG: FKBP-type peptidyl-prolyl cis-trans isomerase [Monoraphidium minutum]